MRNWPLNVSYSHSFRYNRLQKMLIFVDKTVEIQSRNYMQWAENIVRYAIKQKSESQQIFNPYANFNCPYVKNKPMQFVLCFVVVHHIFDQLYSH